MQGPFTLDDSTIDPLSMMDRPTFKRFAKHYLGKEFDRNRLRHDLQLGNGSVEVGLETLLRQRGLTGAEPVPNIRLSGVGNNNPEDQEQAKAVFDRQKAIDSETVRLRALKMPQLRSEAKGLGSTPKSKKEELIKLILERDFGQKPLTSS